VLAVELSLQGVSAGVPIIAIDDHKFGDNGKHPVRIVMSPDKSPTSSAACSPCSTNSRCRFRRKCCRWSSARSPRATSGVLAAPTKVLPGYDGCVNVWAVGRVENAPRDARSDAHTRRYRRQCWLQDTEMTQPVNVNVDLTVPRGVRRVGTESVGADRRSRRDRQRRVRRRR
jgi:hypothetical protein